MDKVALSCLVLVAIGLVCYSYAEPLPRGKDEITFSPTTSRLIRSNQNLRATESITDIFEVIWRSILVIPLVFINIGITIVQTLGLSNVFLFSGIYKLLLNMREYIVDY